MKDKYYTPTKEEFHVGFEYEVFQKGEEYNPNFMYLMAPDTEDKWVKFTFPDPFLGYNLDRMFKTYNMRVKHFDKDDIEELGFEFEGGKLIKDVKDSFRYKGYILDYNYLINRLIVKIPNYIRDGSGNFDGFMILFNGYIKNKSELKRLLKQLNILDDATDTEL